MPDSSNSPAPGWSTTAVLPARPAARPAVARSPRRGQLTAQEVRQAFDEGALVVYYQPKVDLLIERAVGVEALVRLMHPELGLLTPDRFLPTVEAGGLLPRLTELVVEEAARQHATWTSMGLHVPVAVNVAPAALLNTAIVDQLTGACRRHGIGAAGLVVEITESSILTDPTAAGRTLEALAEAGFEVALDDFGTGFSSLSHLRSLPVPVVKMDRSFVRDVSTNDADAHIVRGTIELARGLGKKVVAEGVESAASAELLMLMGCHEGQGFHWAGPMPAHQATRWLRAHTAATTPAGERSPAPPEEPRLAVLHRYRMFDAAYQAIFDDIAEAAARICGTPMSAVSVLAADRQWFKASVGLSIGETTRDRAFCAHTVLTPDRPLVVEDASVDARFADNPLVVGEPGIRFYAGAPLVSPDGHAVGSLCVLDSTPRTISAAQLATLERLARHVVALLEAKQDLHALAKAADRAPLQLPD